MNRSLYRHQCPSDTIYCSAHSTDINARQLPYIALVTLLTSMPVRYHIVHGYSADINARQISYIALVTLQTSMHVKYHILNRSLYRHQCLHILNRSHYRYQCTSDTIYCTGHSRDINARQIPYIALVTLQTSMPSVTI